LPRLVKGGKYVYGWSEVDTTGRIAVPDEALAEYNLTAPCKVILLSGSAHSGGFALTTVSLLKNSVLSRLLDENPKLAGFQLPEGETIMVAGKPCCWVTLNTDGCITVPLKTLKQYGINVGYHLLSVRGSRLVLAFCVKGPLIDEAKQYPSLTLFK
jgi:bifunctional DNA-binding transcriptional regulator/antitoxin component of YhaV-PrlF toxin-antitoxin module